MNAPGGIGNSFDPTRPDPGPQGSSPAQALQVIGLHFPTMFGRGIPNQLTSAPSHVGSAPEAMVLKSLLEASRKAGTGPATMQAPSDGGVADLLKMIQEAIGQPGGGPMAPPTAPPAPAPMAPAPAAPGPPRVTPSANPQTAPGFGNNRNGIGTQFGNMSGAMNSGGPLFGRG